MCDRISDSQCIAVVGFLRAGSQYMSQSKHSRLRELFRRLTSWLRRHAPREPEPPVDPYAYVTAPKKPGHPIAVARPSLSYRKTDRHTSNYCPATLQIPTLG